MVHKSVCVWKCVSIKCGVPRRPLYRMPFYARNTNIVWVCVTIWLNIRLCIWQWTISRCLVVNDGIERCHCFKQHCMERVLLSNHVLATCLCVCFVFKIEWRCAVVIRAGGNGTWHSSSLALPLSCLYDNGPHALLSMNERTHHTLLSNTKYCN